MAERKADRVAHDLLGQIVRGEVPVGAVLPKEDALAQHYGCHRGVVREAVKQLEAAGIVASPVQDIDDLLNWPHLQARGMIDTVSHPMLGELSNLKAAGFPLKFSAGKTGYSGTAAPCGTHNGEVYRDLLGLDSDEIERLAGKSII